MDCTKDRLLNELNYMQWNGNFKDYRGKRVQGKLTCTLLYENIK